MARIVPIDAALTRPCMVRAVPCVPREAPTRGALIIAFDIPSTHITIEFYPRDVCIIREDRGNGAVHRTITDYTSYPIPTGISYAVSSVEGHDGVLYVPPFTIRLTHDGTVAIVSGNQQLPTLTGFYTHR